ncbi:MAG: MbcA/ParS/Xre antitoxin family protein [Acidobacteriia bacterium]|nr:MbcA/ParS/Xre antitoxin family protein [Terriglobia bacterium]
MHRERPVAEDTEREVVINRAIEVIGDKEEAMRWLGMPVRALGYATPISRLNDRDGQTAVLDVLDQLEHGVF